MYSVAALMEGRAGGPKGRYSGKVEKIQKRNEAEKLVREAVEIAASQKISWTRLISLVNFYILQYNYYYVLCVVIMDSWFA